MGEWLSSAGLTRAPLLGCLVYAPSFLTTAHAQHSLLLPLRGILSLLCSSHPSLATDFIWSNIHIHSITTYNYCVLPISLSPTNPVHDAPSLHRLNLDALPSAARRLLQPRLFFQSVAVTIFPSLQPSGLARDESVALRGVSTMDSSGSPQDAGGASHLNGAPQKVPQCDVKPRLTKEQHDVLEQHFQMQHKPSTMTKKDFATRLGVPLDKINVRDHQCQSYATVANVILELVPEPQGQGQAGQEEDREPAEHGTQRRVQQHVREHAQ
jgi:hypothetical protein